MNKKKFLISKNTCDTKMIKKFRSFKFLTIVNYIRFYYINTIKYFSVSKELDKGYKNRKCMDDSHITLSIIKIVKFI